MPLVALSADQALKNLRFHASTWPGRRRGYGRIAGIPSPAIQPGFRFSRADKIFTIGSCFARNIELVLSELGFDVPAARFALPEEEVTTDPNSILNKYVPQAMLNELIWALRPDVAFPEDSYQPAKGGLWFDPHLSPTNQKPAPLARIRENRAMVSGLFRQVKECRIVIVTLGLVEAWWDRDLKLHLNGAPTREAIDAAPGRYEMHVLSYEEIVACLAEMYGILEQYGHPDFRMLVTVSPVPFKATFTGQEAMVANSYSKCVLRAAAEHLVRTSPRVDYFPSYEIVSLSDRSSAYLEDCIHVHGGVVRRIMNLALLNYLEGEDEIVNDIRAEMGLGITIDPGTARAESVKLWEKKDYRGLIAHYRAIERAGKIEDSGFDEFDFRSHLGITLLRYDLPVEAEIELRRALTLDTRSAAVHYWHGVALSQCGRPHDAIGSFAEAYRLNPDNPGHGASLGRLLIELGRASEAGPILRHVLTLDGAHPTASEDLIKVEAASAAA